MSRRERAQALLETVRKGLGVDDAALDPVTRACVLNDIEAVLDEEPGW